jgi:hypothetical protein
MSQKRIRTIGVAAFCAAVLVSAASGQITVYNSFGPGHDGWDWKYNLGWTVAGPDNPSQYGVEQAFSFTATASGPVSDIWVGMFRTPLDTLPDKVTFYLAHNDHWLPPTPDDVMEEWIITEFETWSQWSPPRHLVGSGAAVLQAGQNYWLWAYGHDATWCGWGMNGGDTYNPSLVAPHTLRREGENWLPIANETVSAFRVDLVPEPAVAGLLAMLLAAARRR